MLLLVKLFIQCVSFVKSHEIKCRTEQHITSKSWDKGPNQHSYHKIPYIDKQLSQFLPNNTPKNSDNE